MNENCLVGFECPECKQADAFKINVSGIVLMHDDGCDGLEGDTEWDKNSYCECPECKYSGSVKDFCKGENHGVKT